MNATPAVGRRVGMDFVVVLMMIRIFIVVLHTSVDLYKVRQPLAQVCLFVIEHMKGVPRWVANTYICMYVCIYARTVL